MNALNGKYVKVNSINKYGVIDWTFEDGSIHINLNNFYEYTVAKEDIEKEIIVLY